MRKVYQIQPLVQVKKIFFYVLLFYLPWQCSLDCARTGDLAGTGDFAGTVVFARTVDFVVLVDFRNRWWTSCLRWISKGCGSSEVHWSDGEENSWYGSRNTACEVSAVSLFPSFFNFTGGLLIEGNMWKGNLISDFHHSRATPFVSIKKNEILYST